MNDNEWPVLITGASRGIGLELAREYANAGWFVHACCRHPEDAHDLHQAARADGARVRLHALDVCDPAQIEQLGAELADQRMDLLINNAGVDGALASSLDQLDPQVWQQVHDTHVVGPALLVRSLVPALRRGRRPVIVNVTSRQGSIAVNSSGRRYAYRTSQAALNMLTACLAIDLRDLGISCVSIDPGWVRTRMGGPDAPGHPATRARVIREVIDELAAGCSGRFLDYTGADVPW